MVFRVSEDVCGIDLGLHDEQVLSAYVVEAAEPLVVEPGHPAGIDQLLEGLRTAGVDPVDIRHILPSHVHLDHAGAAAKLCEHAPEAVVHHHPATAEHLVEPAELIASSRAALGDAFEDVGEPTPLPEDRLEHLNPRGATLDLGDRRLEVVPTPGHASDHVSAYLPDADVLFANEAAVNHYPKAGAWLPAATVPGFDPDAVAESAERLEEFDPSVIALAHFGTVKPECFYDRAGECISAVQEQVLSLHDQHGADLAATETAVREELLSLEPYDETVQRLQASVQTRGFLQAAGHR